MPHFTSIGIPVLSDSSAKYDSLRATDRVSAGTMGKSRIHGNVPLPFKPLDNAPRDARILRRVIDGCGVRYELEVDDVKIGDVSVEEVLDFVSPFDLEQFENRQFEEEREVLAVLEQDARERKLKRWEERNVRARLKGVACIQSNSEVSSSDDAGGEEVVTHGRARPTYTHLFGKPQRARAGGRHAFVRDDSTFESAPDDNSSGNDPPGQMVLHKAETSVNLPKRRRRKRDKITGELLPLSPVAPAATTPIESEETKRQRRRRHSITGELMPIVWRYDSNNLNDPAIHRSSGVTSRLMRDLSISEEHPFKRQRLNEETKQQSLAEILARSQSPDRITVNTAKSVIELSSDGEEEEPAVQHDKETIGTKPLHRRVAQRSTEVKMSKTLAARVPTYERDGNAIKASTDDLRAGRRAPVSVSIPGKHGLPTPVVNPSAKAITSIVSPSARSPSPLGADEEGSDDTSEAIEFDIEAILDHQMSDPKTHPAGLGDDPILLYLVKWEGYPKPTWEPLQSFGDVRIVEEYHKRVGLLPFELTVDALNDSMREPVPPVKIPVSLGDPRSSCVIKDTTVDKDDEEDDAANDEEEAQVEEDRYEVESIIGHHLSDPKTHPAGLGKKPIMLYRVMWKGYSKPTWEPEDVFEGGNMLKDYKAQAGLPS